MASNTFRSDPKRAAELAVILAQHAAECGASPTPHRVATLVVDMQKAARTAKRWAENECNYPTTEEQQKRAARREERALHAINEELAAYFQGTKDSPPTIELGGDPRGPCARLHVPGQRGDGWGDGFAVY